MQETDLYQPIKSYLEGQGYEVKSEVHACDLVALKPDEPALIVELKLNLSVKLLLQGVDRLAITDAVYIAVPRKKGARWRGQLRDILRLCRRLGLGFISVKTGTKPALVEVHLDPIPYKPRQSKMRNTALLREFSRRVGDPNTAGQTRRPVMTAYRQDALRLVDYIAEHGASSPARMARDRQIKTAGPILQKDHYGWFIRVSRGVYDLSSKGREALVIYADTLAKLRVNG
ncbi:MAG: hypothetical protein GXP05_16645 [Alphaproteobacteria bacterium]|nr:hypothetical protein [Alphaproteobacteria bacterium]